MKNAQEPGKGTDEERLEGETDDEEEEAILQDMREDPQDDDPPPGTADVRPEQEPGAESTASCR